MAAPSPSPRPHGGGDAAFDALAAFLAPGWPLLGVALAFVAAGVLGRMVARAGTLEALFGLVVAAFAAGVVGPALALR